MPIAQPSGCIPPFGKPPAVMGYAIWLRKTQASKTGFPYLQPVKKPRAIPATLF